MIQKSKKNAPFPINLRNKEQVGSEGYPKTYLKVLKATSTLLYEYNDRYMGLKLASNRIWRAMTPYLKSIKIWSSGLKLMVYATQHPTLMG